MRDTSNDIFVRHRIDLKLNAVTHFQVQNEIMLIAINGQTLLHIRLQNSRQTNLKLPLELHDRIAHIHLDYNGVHGLVSTTTGENFYINTRTGNVKSLKRIKGLIISAIAWNGEFSKDNETGFILMGTTKGSIYETNIASSGTMNYMKQLCTNLTEREFSISGLYFRQINVSVDNDSIYFLLLICTPNRLYCLVGPANMQAVAQQPISQQVVGTVWSSALVEQGQQHEAVLQALFNFKSGKRPRYLNKFAKGEEMDGPPSALAIHPILAAADEQPSRFAWLSSGCIAIGSIDLHKLKRDSVDGYELLSIDTELTHRQSEGRLDFPLDICLTEYHILLLYTSGIAAISLFEHDRKSETKQTPAFKDFFTGVPKIVGMGRDASSQLIWVFADSMVFKYRPNEECRNVWRYFLEQKEFAKAKKLANQLRDKRPFQTIIKREAEKFIGEKNFVAAAESLDQSDEPFEKLVLLMLKDGPSSRNGLKRFLELRLNHFHGTEERMHRDMLVLWLLEIQLAELAELRKQNVCESTAEKIENSDQKEAEISCLKNQLYCFLNRQVVFEALTDNQAVVYRMISSHVDFDVQLWLAQKLRDYQTVIKIQLMQKTYKEVLDVLAKEGQSKPELFYQYAEELIAEVPHELITLILRHERTLNPLKLLPAFQRCFDPNLTNRTKIVEATFSFIERIIPSNNSGPLLDFSIRLFATFRSRDLQIFLKKYIPLAPKQNDAAVPPFDMGQAMRICTEHGLTECRVFLLCVEGQYEDAVRLALTISVELAKQCARQLDEAIEQREQESLADFLLMDERHGRVDLFRNSSPVMAEMRKRVWLEIAKSMIQSGASISHNLALLEQSKGAIRIQDVLSYFPEFTKIEHFKEPLLASLKEYSSEIKLLQREIHDATEMAEELRDEIDRSRSGFMVIRTTGQCSFCRQTLLQRPFVAFICRHFFHRDCLEMKTKEKSNEYANLESEERILRKELQLATMGANLRTKKKGLIEQSSREETTLKKLDSIRARMKELLCGDCPLCGLHTIEEVDKPFYEDPSTYLEQLKLWIP